MKYAALLLVIPTLASAEVYRCGSSYQATPCDGGQRLEIRATAPAADRQVAEDVCRTAFRASLKDPDTVQTDWKVEGGSVQTSVVDLDGRTVPALVWVLRANAKNSYGGYTGLRSYFCRTSLDGRRFLQMTSN